MILSCGDIVVCYSCRVMKLSCSEVVMQLNFCVMNSSCDELSCCCWESNILLRVNIGVW